MRIYSIWEHLRQQPPQKAQIPQEVSQSNSERHSGDQTGSVARTNRQERLGVGRTRWSIKLSWQNTLKSERDAISSSSSRVAEEADIRVCCWLAVTRWGLLTSPWLTVIAGLVFKKKEEEKSAFKPGRAFLGWKSHCSPKQAQREEFHQHCPPWPALPQPQLSQHRQALSLCQV